MVAEAHRLGAQAEESCGAVCAQPENEDVPVWFG
jgi:hypothetical protein